MVRGGPSKRPAAEVDASEDESQESPVKRIKQRDSDVVRVKKEHYANGHGADSQASQSRSQSRAADDEVMEEDDESDFERDVSDDEDIDWADNAENVAALERVRRETRNEAGAEYAIPKAGVIKSVQVIDFMNHRNWEYKNFGAKINFIVGHNGSGKSAVLTAIAIALGARASVTGRGSGVKDLIRRGAEKATIIVTLLNNGPTAYNPEKYPCQIVIERSFDRKGATFYKFRAAKDGPILETKRQELDNITSHFSINMDSPLTLLTQDMAKSFLATADEGKLYDFFLGGSSLKQLSNQYQEIENLVNKMERDVKTIEESIPGIQRRADKYQRLVEAGQRQATMNQELAEVRHKLGWAFVIQREGQLEAQRDILENEQRKLAKVIDAIAELTARSEELEETMKRMTEELDESLRQGQPLKEQFKELKERYNDKNRELRAAKGVLEDAKIEIEQKKRELQNIIGKIAARESQNGPVESPQETKLREDLRRYNNIRSNMTRQEPELRRSIPAIEQKLAEAQNEVRVAEGRRDEVAVKLENAKRQEANLAQRRTDPMAAFGDRIDMVLTAIKRAKWREPPLGPLGRYVQLKDHNYIRIVHSLLGATLCSFAVRYPEDKDQLMRILRSCASQGYVPGTGARQIPQIFMHKGDRFDFSAGDLSNRGRTILSVLNITDETVLRILVDLVRIERIFLAPNQHEALDMVNNLLQSGLQNVTVFSEDIWRNSGGPGEFRNSGPATKWQGNNLFVKDTTAALAALREQINTLGREHAAVVDECKQRIAHVRQVERDLKSARDKLRTIETGMVEATRRASEIQDQLDALQPDDGDTLQQARDDAEQALEQMEIERAKVELDIKTREEEVRALEQEMNTTKEKQNKLLPAQVQKRDAIQQQGEQRLKCRSDLEFRKRGRVTCEQKVATAEADVAKMEDEQEDWIAKATEIGPRLDVVEAVPELQRRVVALMQSIEEAKKRNGIDIDEALAKYNQTCQEMKSLKDNSAANKTLVKNISRGLRRRQDMWLYLRNHAAVRVGATFTHNLNTRNFEGTISFDHDGGRLRLRVNTTASAVGVEEYAKSANRLSGGERSYSTVCFLLALWETCSTTIACLDEWDVFLDSVNRQLAGQLIMEGARDMVGKQFILITPLDMGGLQVEGEHNKIIRLGDPERGQTTLV